jgi:hypothetical protein
MRRIYERFGISDSSALDDGSDVDAEAARLVEEERAKIPT